MAVPRISTLHILCPECYKRSISYTRQQYDTLNFQREAPLSSCKNMPSAAIEISLLKPFHSHNFISLKKKRMNCILLYCCSVKECHSPVLLPVKVCMSLRNISPKMCQMCVSIWWSSHILYFLACTICLKTCGWMCGKYVLMNKCSKSLNMTDVSCSQKAGLNKND